MPLEIGRRVFDRINRVSASTMLRQTSHNAACAIGSVLSALSSLPSETSLPAQNNYILYG